MITHFEPFLVVGPGRSGTSFVARVLRDEFGVFMGAKFRTDPTNPEGFCEDREWVNANNAVLADAITENAWRGRAEKLLIDRRARGVLWGMKDPRFAEPQIDDLLRPYVRYTRVIRCRRSRQAVVASMRRCYGWSLEEAEGLRARREHTLDHLDLGARVCEINIDNGPTVADVVRQLEGHHAHLRTARTHLLSDPAPVGGRG